MDLLHELNLEEMVAAADGSQLAAAALLRSGGDSCRIGLSHSAAFLCELGIHGLAEGLLNQPAGAVHQYSIQLWRFQFDRTRAAGSARNIAEDLIDQFAKPWPYVIRLDRRAHETHAAIDVEAYSAW